MERRDNYAITVQRAKALFLEFDQQELSRKLGARMDESFLYVTFLARPYRIHRGTGDLSRYQGEQWVSANSFGEVLTVLDLVCDSWEERCICGRWKNMRDFGRGFHQQLLEQSDPWADLFQQHPRAFAAACERLGGQPYPVGDVAYAIPVFEDLLLLIQLWFGDEEFPAQLRYLWDENALQYLKYETMFYAVPLVLGRITEQDFVQGED